MKDVLLVFARMPEPGKCKTRLIPKLGMSAATELHAQMTHRTLAWSRQLARTTSIAIEVHFSGGTQLQMSETFGNDLDYIPQVTGDLGTKLIAAFARSRTVAPTRTVVVGTDCPQLSAAFVESAFARLVSHDVCVAPAVDGGYVLLGLNLSSVPKLSDAIFYGIDWGTPQVLKQTVASIAQSGATCSLLPTLADVDNPEDLGVWHTALADDPAPVPSVSVIIPVNNEEPALAATVDSAQHASASEVIVMASGRFQQSLQVAAEKRVQFIVSTERRGLRLNIGASLLRASTLLFLHADTQLPTAYASDIAHALKDSKNVGGAFRLQLDSVHPLARWVEWGVRWRSDYGRLPYGDQALFVRRDIFEQLGGFCDQPIMEDYEFIRRLRRAGRIAMSRQVVRTSARRWEGGGFIRTTLMNQCMLIGYHLGVPPERLARFYRSRKVDGAS